MNNRRRRQAKARRRLEQLREELMLAPVNDRFLVRMKQFEALQAHYWGMLAHK
jgi:hypothetical protein